MSYGEIESKNNFLSKFEFPENRKLFCGELMNESELIVWLSLKCYFKICNSFTGMYMVPELLIYFVEAEIRLKKGVFKFNTRSKETLLPALVEMKEKIEHWYKINAPEYLEEI